MVDFSGWQMPIQYAEGIVAEHLTTRRHSGLFDVSHMGRFHVSGSGAAAFLRHVLTNDCEKLVVGQAHYTMIANETGGAVDDAFLYRPDEEKYLLVVNASTGKRGDSANTGYGRNTAGTKAEFHRPVEALRCGCDCCQNGLYR